VTAERVGFEPTKSFDSALFKSAAINRSATSPRRRIPVALEYADELESLLVPRQVVLRRHVRYHDGAGDQVVPPSSPSVDEDPDETEMRASNRDR
jgi:hypothetical protein